MNRLKLEYIFSNYLLVTMVILSIALGLCPVVLAIVFCILKGPINLLILLALFVSLPFSGCLLFFCADEYEDTTKEYKFQKRMLEIEEEIEADRRKNPEAYEGHSKENY